MEQNKIIEAAGNDVLTLQELTLSGVDVTEIVDIDVSTVLPRITARAFISFQWFLTRPPNETDVNYQKKYMLFIICDASDEF